MAYTYFLCINIFRKENGDKMKNSKLKYTLSIVIFLFAMLFSTFCAHATGGNGTSQEGGEGSQGVKSLTFISCTLEDGSKIDNEQGITLQPKFTLKFDKNVVNMLMWERNRKCFIMSGDGNVQVPITVSKIDDTVDFNHRQEIFVQPVNALEQGKTYHIKVSPDLLAKNGNSTLGDTTDGKGVTISFKTKQESTSKPAVTEQNVSQKSSEVKNSEQTKADNASVNTNKGSEENKTGNETKSLMVKMTPTNWLTLVTVLLIICWISIEIFIKRKKKKEGSNKPQV